MKALTALLVSLACLLAPAQGKILESVRSGEVLIQRDRWGVPHIYGQSANAVAFGFGYAQSEDHLERMLKLYLKARGEFSKVEGPEALTGDLIERALLTPEIIDRTWGRVPQPSKEYYQAFADGIDRYIETHPEEKLPWYWKVEARDVAIYVKFAILRDGWQEAVAEMTGKRDGSGDGSNAWAISGARSASGHAMLLGDPHLSWQSDVQWYEAHLKCPEFDFAGATFFGMPIPALGHNADLAWTCTNNTADIADVYREKLDPRNPERYQDSDGRWKTMEKRTFEIQVLQADRTLKTVTRTMSYTPRGPYVPAPGGQHYSVAIAGWKDMPDVLTGFIGRAAAHNLKEFKTALTNYPLDKWHIVAATRSGDIYVAGNGYFPRRDAKYNWRKPVPGWEKDAQWKGIIPFGDLPQFTDPPSGLIVQCNNSVFSSAHPSPIEPADYPPYVAAGSLQNPPSSRDGRAYSLLAMPKIAWEDHRRAALDVKALTAGPLMQLLLAAAQGDSDPDVKEIRSILESWDYMATLDNQAVPILSQCVKMAMVKHVDLRGALSGGSSGSQAQVLSLLQSVAAEMKRVYGKVGVPMRDVQIVKRGREYPVPGVGAAGTLNPFTSLYMSGATQYRDGKFYASAGSSWLMLLAFDSPIKVLSVMPTGNSENPASPHFADLTALFSGRELKPFPFTDDQVTEFSEKSYRLKLP